MIKNFLPLCIFILFLNNCGYTPIYSKKSQNFEINKIETFGETKVNKVLLSKLKIYKNNTKTKKSIDIIITSKSVKTTTAKDKKGNPTQFSIVLTVNVKILDDLNNDVEVTFSESNTYDNSTNKFDLRKYEDNLIKNMIEKIFSEIILFIQTKN